MNLPLRLSLIVAVAAWSIKPAAAALTLQPEIVAVYANDGLLTPAPLPDFGSPLPPQIYEIALSFSASDLAPEQGIANLAFAVTLNGLTTAGVGYAPDASTFDLNGELAGGGVPKFALNADIGASSTDLRGILASVLGPGEAFSSNDPRRTLGQQSPSYVGSLFVLWDGSDGASLTLHGVNQDKGVQYSVFGPSTTEHGGLHLSLAEDAPQVTLTFTAAGPTVTTRDIPALPAVPVDVPVANPPVINPPEAPIAAPPSPPEPPVVDTPITLPEPEAPATIPDEPPATIVLPTEPPVPSEPIIDNPAIAAVPVPEIRIGYDPPNFIHEGWLWNCDLTDIMLVDGAGLQITGAVDFDGALQSLKDSSVITNLAGASYRASTLFDGGRVRGGAVLAADALVPEPSSTLLALVSLLALSSARRSRLA